MSPVEGLIVTQTLLVSCQFQSPSSAERLPSGAAGTGGDGGETRERGPAARSRDKRGCGTTIRYWVRVEINSPLVGEKRIVIGVTSAALPAWTDWNESVSEAALEVVESPVSEPEKARSMLVRASSRNGAALVASGWRITLNAGCAAPAEHRHPRRPVLLVLRRVLCQVRLAFRPI